MKKLSSALTPETKFAELLQQLTRLYPSFREGRHVPFDLQFLRIVKHVQRHPGPDYGPLFQPIVARAMRHRDSQLLVRLHRLIDLGIPLYRETVTCAQERWQDGFALLRSGNEDVPLVGLTLVDAYLIDDENAYDRARPVRQLREDARNLISFVRNQGGNLSDAIAFISRCDLGHVNMEDLK